MLAAALAALMRVSSPRNPSVSSAWQIIAQLCEFLKVDAARCVKTLLVDAAIAQVLPGADDATIAALEARAHAMPPVTTQIDAGAEPEDLVAALAGSLEVRYTRTYALAYTCTCSRDRVERALLGLGRDELEKILREQDRTEAICEFCKTAYVLSRDEVTGLIARLEARN